MSRFPRVLVPHPHVRVDQKVLGGSPYVLGSRVPVRRLFSFYRSGATVEKILLRYPQLSAAQVFDSLAFALDNPEVMDADIERDAVLLDARTQQPKAARGETQAAFEFAFESAHDPSRSRSES